MATSPRPSLTADVSGVEFARWYWLKTELVVFARELGIRTTGSKATLTARIAAALDRQPFTEPDTAVPEPGQQLAGTLTEETVIPAGQRCSRAVREWFVSQVGEGFRFDGPMRDFFAGTNGSDTLRDALNHWHQTRTAAPKPIDKQFEFNRFTRDWYAKNPGGSPQEMREAWHEFRGRPLERRHLEDNQ